MSGLLVQPVVPQEAPGELPSISSQHAHIREGGFSISVEYIQPGCRERVRQSAGKFSPGYLLSALGLKGVRRQGWRQLHQLSAHGFFDA